MANRKSDIKSRLLATFREEAEEHLQAIAANLSALEGGLPPAKAREAVEATFREVHTLKGAARSVGLADVEALCQACEALLSRVKGGEVPLSAAVLERLQEAADGVARLLAGREEPGEKSVLVARLGRAAADFGKLSRAGPAPGAAERAESPEALPGAPALPAGGGFSPTETIRLPAAKLDALILRAEELLGPKLAAAERVREAGALIEALERLRGDRKREGGKERGSPEPGPRASEPKRELRELGAKARELLRNLARDERAMAGAADGLQEEMRRLRMTPASAILGVFPRMVRDLAGSRGKEVECVVRGGELEVDRKVLEAAKDPLIHLLRNAVDHGIEAPEARAKAGKPPRGRVGVSLTPLEGNRVEVCVEDDGAGIDPSRVKAAAVRARLLTEEAARALSEEAALELVYRSGLSTSPIITDVSGHGLGLAIVRERAERLGGQVRIETRAGRGTKVRMVLPVSIATFRGLLVQAGKQLFLLPLESVERAIRLAPEEIQSVEGRRAVRWDGRVLPVGRLGEALGLGEEEGGAAPGRRHPCVVVRSGEERAGLLAQEVLGEREVLVKELRPPLARVPHVAGAGLLGTGELVLILRPADLLRSIRQAPRPAAPSAPTPEERRQPSILVVDDSITTRTMEKNLLEAAGYRVKVAVDGREAWTALKSEEFDLVVSDVDMPRMDGFELTARIRADEKRGDLPVVLVTVLDSREHKERGIEAGANAYIVKSSFDQSNLLEIIRRLV